VGAESLQAGGRSSNVWKPEGAEPSPLLWAEPSPLPVRPIARPSMAVISSVYVARAKEAFAAHCAGDSMAPVTPWRDWLIAGIGAGLWFAVPKADPTQKPKAFLCSLAQAKANLKAGF
jgi:hypothetical protein